jgi:hypothetical protein
VRRASTAAGSLIMPRALAASRWTETGWFSLVWFIASMRTGTPFLSRSSPRVVASSRRSSPSLVLPLSLPGSLTRPCMSATTESTVAGWAGLLDALESGEHALAGAVGAVERERFDPQVGALGAADGGQHVEHDDLLLGRDLVPHLLEDGDDLVDELLQALRGSPGAEVMFLTSASRPDRPFARLRGVLDAGRCGSRMRSGRPPYSRTTRPSPGRTGTRRRACA